MKIHFIGIGGIGVSALAQYYLSKGHEVSGSDLVASEITDFLKKKGIKIFIGNSAENIKNDFDLIVFQPDNSGLQSRPDHAVAVFAKTVDPDVRQPVLLRPLIELSVLDPADAVDARDP